MNILVTIVFAAILAFFGRFLGGIYLFLIGLAGLPGALLTFSPNSFVQRVGKAVNILGACYALVAFVAFVVAINRYLTLVKGFVVFPLWVEAFVVAYSPVWFGYVEIRAKQANSETLAPMQNAWGLMSYVVIISFLVFVVFGYYGLWEWVEAAVRYCLPRTARVL